MKLVEVEAVEDRSRAEGGHAMILLRGVERTAGSVSFTLQPVSADADGDGDSGSGDAGGRFPPGGTALEPLAVTMTADGMALSVGPDIAESALFVPGAAVEITLAGQGVRGEFLWPAVTPLARPKRRNIMIRRSAADTFSRPVEAAVPVPAAEDVVQSAKVDVGEPAPPPPATPAPVLPVSSGITAAAAEPLAQRPVEICAVPPRPPVRAAAPIQWPLSIPPPASGIRSSRTMATGTVLALAAVSLLGSQVIALRAFNLSVVPRQATVPGGAPPSSVLAAPAGASVPAKAEPASVAVRAAAPPRSIYDVISAGPRSPRGMPAADVSPAKALQIAHTLLHGNETQRDPEEAAYWLKHYLAGASGSDNLRIALTQLGSAYAQPVRGERDLASARITWELAGALGDPVAMCFLGALHEHGLGVPQAGAIAATWYERAAAVGRACATAQHAAR